MCSSIKPAFSSFDISTNDLYVPAKSPSNVNKASLENSSKTKKNLDSNGSKK